MAAPRIVDRDSFAAALDEAQQLNATLLAADPSWSLSQHLDAQLALMRSSTADGRVPDERVRAQIDVGPLAARHFDGHHDRYAAVLKDLGYAFQRYSALLPPLADAVEGRRGILQVLYGPDAFHKHTLAPGERVVVGRGERAGMVLRDKQLGARHLEARWDGVCCHVRDLDAPGGLALNGVQAWCGELKNGGVIAAGGSTLRFFVEGHTPPPPVAEPAARGDVEDARAALAEPLARGTLYAVLDAARDRRLLQLLEEAVDGHASLYEGEAGRALDRVAPYLVKLSADTRSQRHGLPHRLLSEGLGRSWGIWLVSDSAPRLVRRSLRRLLMVEAEGQRERLYFRFYDPRVLSRFLPLATPRQRSEIFAEADALYYEDAGGALCRATEGDGA